MSNKFIYSQYLTHVNIGNICYGLKQEKIAFFFYFERP